MNDILSNLKYPNIVITLLMLTIPILIDSGKHFGESFTLGLVILSIYITITNRDKAENWYSIFASMLLFPAFALLGTMERLGDATLVAMILIGAYIAISEKENPFKIKELKVFSWITTGYFFTMLFSVLISDVSNIHDLNDVWRFGFASLAALTIFKIDIPLKSLLLSVKVGLIVMGVSSIVWFSLGYTRPAGVIWDNMNVGSTASMTAIMLFFSAIQIFKETPKERAITFIALILGIASILISQTRGVWIATLVLGFIYFAFMYKQYLHNNKYKFAIFGGVLTLLLLAASTSIVQDRVSTAVKQINGWSYDNINDSNPMGSVSARLNMWVSGLKAFQDSPWVGHGYKNTFEPTKKHINYDYSELGGLHQAYIEMLVWSGIIGLISLISLQFAPLVIFYRGLKSNDTFHYALMGVFLCMGYIIPSFFGGVFHGEPGNAFYILFLAFLLSKTIATKQGN